MKFPGRPKTFKDAVLQPLSDEDDRQTEKQSSEALFTTCQYISKCLQAMEKIRKIEKRVPHELTDK